LSVVDYAPGSVPVHFPLFSDDLGFLQNVAGNCNYFCEYLFETGVWRLLNSAGL